MSSSRLAVTAILRNAGDQHKVRVHGQTARTLLALVNSGPRGVSALECGAWAFRLAAYCHRLRHRYGLTIRTDKESHPGGWHGRHVLETPIEIVAVDGEPLWRPAA